MTTWKTLREELKLTEDDEKVIALEKSKDRLRCN